MGFSRQPDSAAVTAGSRGCARIAAVSSEEPQVLIVDDETGSREAMAVALERGGLRVRTFDDARRALTFLEEASDPLVVVCDLRMPGLDGLSFLGEVRQKQLPASVIVVTAFGSIESAVEAMRAGADDYLAKPVDLYELRRRVSNQVERQRLQQRVTELAEQLDKRYGFEAILGRSPEMERLFEQMRLVAPTRSTVLIIGESGTGKELVAHALHRASSRRDERFLALNCGAIPPDILESELFGHEKGSFTGAVGRKIGKFELAHKGTLFLDEISELYSELQVKLLRVLEERQIMRVGGIETIAVDFRLIAATNRDLERQVAEGKFREDLYYRLKVVTLRLPPLRDRIEDLPVLADHFLRSFAREHNREVPQLSAETLSLLARYRWPGNVRELRNAMEWLVIFHGGRLVEPPDLPEEIRVTFGIEGRPLGAASERDGAGLAEAGGAVLGGATKTLADLEREAILGVLAKTGGRRAEAARMLNIGLRTLQRKLKEYRQQGFYQE